MTIQLAVRWVIFLTVSAYLFMNCTSDTNFLWAQYSQAKIHQTFSTPVSTITEHMDKRLSENHTQKSTNPISSSVSLNY